VNQSGQVDHMAKDLEEFVMNLGFKVIESHKVFIHRSLTREIMVYEKK
jgi:tRNA G10  N-methylase Trm11